MKVGDLVQLLEPHGAPVPSFYGIVTRFTWSGNVCVHWQNTSDNPLNNVANAWPHGRLKVVNETR